MADWTAPKTNWGAGNVVSSVDMNRIEEDNLHNYQKTFTWSYNDTRVIPIQEIGTHPATIEIGSTVVALSPNETLHLVRGNYINSHQFYPENGNVITTNLVLYPINSSSIPWTVGSMIDSVTLGWCQVYNDAMYNNNLTTLAYYKLAVQLYFPTGTHMGMGDHIVRPGSTNLDSPEPALNTNWSLKFAMRQMG